MIKNGIHSATVCTVFLFSGTVAMAGSPYNLAVPAPGLKFQPHVAQPVMKVKPANRHPVLTTQPTIRRSLNTRQRLTVVSFPYTAITQNRARRQGKISAGGANWNCKGTRCTTSASWTRPTVQTCKALAGVVGAIQSYGKHGASLNPADISSCNAGIAVAKSKRKIGTAFNPGLAARAPIFTPNQLVRPQAHGGFAPPTGSRRVLSAPPSGGGFAPSVTPRTKIPDLNVPGVGQGGNPFRGKGGVPPIHMGPQPPDSVNTGQLSLVAKPQPPDVVDTGQLSLVAKPQPPDVVDTGQLSLISKTQIPDVVPTGPLILKGKGP